ncbi:hypothetical protein Tco_1305461, partial [Tanacetum coccineum]
SPDDEEETRSSQEYINDLEEEYQVRALLAKSKRFFKKVSSDDNEVHEVKALMALADEERISVSKESAINGEWIKISMKKHVNAEILKENQNLRNELKELTSITEAWLNSSNKVNQCISEQIPTQKKKILGIDQLTKDTSSSRPKDLVFVKSSVDNSEVSITGSNKPKLSEAEDFTLSNHDTGKVPSNESQRNTTDHSVVISDSSATDYDSADESLVCSTPLPPLEKLTGAEPVSGPKTIKSILKSKSTFKAETLKGITINEPSLAPARGNKSSSVSKTNSAPAKEESNLETLNMSQRTVKHVVAMFIPHLITVTFSGSGKEKLFKLRKLSLSKQCNIRKSSSRLNNCRSKHTLPAQIWDVPGPEGMYGNHYTYITEGYGYGIVFKNEGKANVPQHEH